MKLNNNISNLIQRAKDAIEENKNNRNELNESRSELKRTISVFQPQRPTPDEK